MVAPSDRERSWPEVHEALEELWKRGELASSAQIIEAAAKRWPAEPNITLARVSQLMREYRVEPSHAKLRLAKKHLVDAVSVAEGDPHVLLSAVQFMLDLGDTAGATEHALRVAKMVEDLDEGEIAALANSLGRIATSRGDVEDAEDQFRSAFELRPGTYDYTSDLVLHLLSLERFDAALDVIAQARRYHTADSLRPFERAARERRPPDAEVRWHDAASSQSNAAVRTTWRLSSSTVRK